MPTRERPNIILIMTDQQRADTIGAHGYDYMTTPHLDRLALRGMSFRQAFCGGATCVASRSAIFTGMYAHNSGVYSFDDWSHHRSWVQDLADGGYHCVNIGKMHVSPRDERIGFQERVVVENPTSDFARQGVADDEWGKHLSMHGRKRPFDRHKSDPDWHSKYQGVPWEMEEQLHSDVFIGDCALAWLHRYEPKQAKPLFLQIGFTGPHEPYDPLPRHLKLYEDKNIPAPVWKHEELAEKPPQHQAHQQVHYDIEHESTIAMHQAEMDDLLRMRRHYYAKITTLDEKIGEIMQSLQDKGYLDNAIVIFTSDHGDLLGDHRLPYKWLMYDPVVHVPLMIWDSHHPVGASAEDLVSLIDIGPTVLDYAEIPAPAYVEGRSLRPYMENRAGEAQEYVYCEDNYLTMIRSKQYKLVKYTNQPDEGELYDLTNDPHELNNLFHDTAYNGVRSVMQQAMLEWLLSSTYASSGTKNRSMQAPRRWPEPPYELHN